jgi:hypothetical protein
VRLFFATFRTHVYVWNQRRIHGYHTLTKVASTNTLVRAWPQSNWTTHLPYYSGTNISFMEPPPQVRDMPDSSTGLAVFGTLSGFTVIVGAAMLIALIAGFVAAYQFIETHKEIATEMGVVVALILTGVISVMLFVCIFCSTIHPREMFVDAAAAAAAAGDSVSANKPEDTLLNGIADAEQKVCELIQRTDKYIESDVGKPGQDDPSLVVAAQRKARAAVPGNALVDCTASAPVPIVADADARLTLMENSLKWFTGPELEKAYKKAMAGCENFVSYWSSYKLQEGFDTSTTIPGNAPASTADIGALQQRLNTVMSEIADQHRQYLDPMDKQTDRLNRGEVSDCQKQMGANAGADAAAKSKPLPAGTSMSDL